MRFTLAVSSIALLILAPAVTAQSSETTAADAVRSVQISLTRSISAPHQGWGWGEATRTVGLRVGVPVAGRTQVWLSAHRAEINIYTCPDVPPGCPDAGTPHLLHAGVGYRAGADVPGRVVPFAGVGAGLERWTGGARAWTPHVHGGLDWFLGRPLALRIEAQSEWAHPARIGTGVVLNLR
jgi:hypothetical protein